MRQGIVGLGAVRDEDYGLEIQGISSYVPWLLGVSLETRTWDEELERKLVQSVCKNSEFLAMS